MTAEIVVKKSELVDFIGEVMEQIDGEWGSCRCRHNPSLISAMQDSWQRFGLTVEDMREPSSSGCRCEDDLDG